MDLPAPLSSPLADFLRHLASEKRYSPHTCDNYRRDLTRLAHWLAGEGPADPGGNWITTSCVGTLPG